MIKSSRLFVKDRISNLRFLVDTGADLSVIPYNIFNNKIFKKDSNFCLSAANGTVINTFGTKLIEVDLGLRRSLKHEFIIAQVNRPIIGADFLSEI